MDAVPRKRPLDPPGRRAGRGALGLLLVLVLLAVLTGGSLVGYYHWCQGASGEQTSITFRVPDGASGGQVVDLLHEQGVIRCGLFSKFLLTRSGLGDSIRAGTFDIATNMTPAAAFEALTHKPEPAPTVRLTIPEGYRLTQIADRVEEALGIPTTQFLDAAESGDYALPPYLPPGEGTTEGFLFPKTYQFPTDGTTPNDLIERLLQQFREDAAGLPWTRAKALGLTPYEVVIVASMVEREARVPRDRAMIAAVIYNRLRDGMILGIDATLQYVDPNPEDGLTESDLAIESPYNTRLHTGLPPTPIASPGRASIEAALSPARTDDLYYVLCGKDGHHAFTASYDRFLRLKAQCLG